jgi:aminoglycoside N3'-acetyltransferase
VNYDFNDIVKGLTDSGIEKGDTVFFTTGLGMIGIPPDSVKSEQDLSELYFNAIKFVLGCTGTLIVPTYSYTFGKSTANELEIFDPKTTPTEIGPFPNYILKQENVKRSLDPMVSVAGLGPNCDVLFQNISNSSYGDESFFSKIVKSEAKFCNVGLGPNWTPFIHYADWLYRVPFRYDKIFYGKIKYNGEINKTSWIYSVRILSKVSLPSAYKAGELSFAEGIWKHSQIGRAKIYSTRASEYFKFVCSYLEKDKWFLAKGPQCDVINIEKSRIDSKYKYIHFPSFNCISWLNILQKIRLDVVSNGVDNVFGEIYKEFNGEITKIKTGEWISDYIVPEKWEPVRGKITDLENKMEYDINSESLNIKPYSLNFKGEVSKENLLKHININQEEEESSNRDWGFNADNAFIKRLNAERYYVEIECAFSLGELKYLELNTDRSRINENILVSYICNDHNKLLGLVSSLEIFRKKYYNLRLLIVSNYSGYLSWLSNNPKFSGNAMHLGLDFNNIKLGDNPVIKCNYDFNDHIFLNKDSILEYQNAIHKSYS